MVLWQPFNPPTFAQKLMVKSLNYKDMKREIKKLSLVVLIAISSSVHAQIPSATIDPVSQEVFYIKGVKFVDALLEKWISEYSKTHPDISLFLADKDIREHSIEVVPLGNQKNDDLQTQATTITFGKYAVLPIAGKNNVLLDELKKKKLNEKRLKELFFEKDMFAEDSDPDKKEKYDAVVYSGNNSYSVSHFFAGHFGYETSSLKGKKIAGDDIYLNNAIKKDAQGVSFNYLGYVFNIESRQINDGIALLPLDVKKEYAEVLNAQNLDETITLLENKDIGLIPVEELVFVLPEEINLATLQFLEWALSEGQDYIHSFGFLQLDTKTLAQQRKQVSELGTKFLANK
jgi:ABC-type phosphate transport system substrate-binding protein